MAKEKRTAKRKTGNCWHERHHTCKGYGKMRRPSGLTIYTCLCPCHKDKKELESRVKRVEGAWKGLAERKK